MTCFHLDGSRRSPARSSRRAPGQAALVSALLFALALACASARPPPPPPAPPSAAEAMPVTPAPPPVDAARELALGREALKDGHVEEARQHLEAAAQADPGAAEPRLDLAELLISEGADLEHAEGLLRETQTLQVERARWAHLSGALKELRGDEAGAGEAYRAALELAPDPDLRLRRGLLLLRLGKAAEAESELARVLAERPGERAGRTELAELYERAGRSVAAEHELAVLAALAPSDAAPLRALVAFYRRHGEQGKAVVAEHWARALDGEGRKLRPLLPARR
jgi:Tfp pilus assembly protein PilF